MELEIVKLFSQLGAGWIDPVTIFISSNTMLGIVGIIITAYIFTNNKKNGKQIALACAIAVALHFLFSEIFFKHVLPEFGLFRMRPYLAHPGEIIPLGKLNSDSSFPSSHMAYTLSLLTVYVYFYRKYLLPAAVFALFMAFVRMHNGMHYPSDVLAGTVLGIIYGFAGIYASGSKKISHLF
jgi:undecaprenyl-diphosphatase